MIDDEKKLPESSKTAKITRGALQVVGGVVPIAGGFLSAIAGAWSEGEQEKVNRFFEDWVRMLHDELKEKQDTIIDIMARLDLQDEEIAARVESKEYQSLVKKTFREWSGVESEEKRKYIRNILSNAAASKLSSDDVVRLYIDWINLYSEMHFQVIAAIYNNNGITRGQIWRKIGKGVVREDSADADLYKLLIRDLSTGSIIRQHRLVDYHGNFIPKPTSRASGKAGSKVLTSAFDDSEGYELTGLGEQFIHYAMTSLPLKIEFSDESQL
ncbi:hypothetical protein [Yersinia kristensenii]|nr:hypothetical protein [Yersinia kristensenii]MDA5507552.1 hypothetical protein [Yersinia kristensenii]NIK97076.1 hypothetical protein [Yersinia kristensenii]NIL07925.1 hypothetical protein [Yersinia kristensenii]PJE84463.1 hypothetical protein CU276_06465 [Yersinia kristensenii]